MKFVLSILLIHFFTEPVFSQTDWVKWEKNEISYTQKNNFKERNYSINADDFSELITKSFANAYWFFVSDLDGDNCPFTPSCSEFFVASVEETNLFQGTLMFFDRFTRDINFYKRNERYPIIRDGRFYDPAELYTFDDQKFLVLKQKNE